MLKGSFTLGVRWLALPVKSGELFPTAVTYSINDIRIGVTDKVKKRGCLSVFFSHKQERYKWRQQDKTGSQF
jgi:hypothetical protein